MIALWGDSITAASNLGPRVTPHPVQNNAVAGTMLTQVVATVLAQVQASSANIAICRYGVNDAIFGANPDAFSVALNQFIATARNSGKTPVLTTLTLFSGGFPGFTAAMIYAWQEINNRIITAAQTYGVNLINIRDGVPAAVFPPPGDTPDGLHPNQAYYDRIDDYIAQQLTAQGLIP